MGLFNFLKAKKEAQTNRLEDALRDAFENNENIPDLYRVLLAETVYVVADTGKKLSIGSHTIKEAIPVKFEIFENGALAFFSSRDRLYDNGLYNEDEYLTFLVYDGRKFLKDSRGQKLVLNPYSNNSLILEPEEINELLNANVYVGNQFLERQNLTQPSNYPI